MSHASRVTTFTGFDDVYDDVGYTRDIELNPINKQPRSQQGFTLLELLIAMAIFAMLAVAGWQVFDGLNRAKERAQYHANQLSELQYAYLQLQQDMAQIVPYQDTSGYTTKADTIASPSASNPPKSPNTPNTPNETEPKQETDTKPLFELTTTTLSFVRFADPDPRYQSSPALIRIEYVFDNEQLIRRQFADIDKSAQAVSLDSVLIDEVKGGKWQAYTPEVTNQFPTNNSLSNNTATATTARLGQEGEAGEEEYPLLPKGVGTSFTYYELPISWTFALTPPAPKAHAKKSEEQPKSPSQGSEETPTPSPQ